MFIVRSLLLSYLLKCVISESNYSALTSYAHLLEKDVSMDLTSEISSRLHNDHTSIFVEVIIRNFLHIELTKGRGKCYKDIFGKIHPQAPIPEQLCGGCQGGFVVQFISNARGCSGSCDWEVSGGLQIQLMWTVPFSFDWLNSHVGTELSMDKRDLDASFDAIYHSPSKVVRSGTSLAMDKLNNISVFARMLPANSYRPVITLDIVSEEAAMMYNFLKPRIVDNGKSGFSFVTLVWIICCGVMVISGCCFVSFACKYKRKKYFSKVQYEAGEDFEENNLDKEDNFMRPSRGLKGHLMRRIWSCEEDFTIVRVCSKIDYISGSLYVINGDRSTERLFLSDLRPFEVVDCSREDFMLLEQLDEADIY